MDAIETRISKIEHQVRFLRRIIAFLIILLVAGVSYGVTAPIPEVIQARRFEVVNQNGRNLVFVGESVNGSGIIQIFQEKGEGSISLLGVSSKSGPAIYLLNTLGGKSVDIFTDKNSNGNVVAFDRQGKVRTLKPR